MMRTLQQDLRHRFNNQFFGPLDMKKNPVLARIREATLERIGASGRPAPVFAGARGNTSKARKAARFSMETVKSTLNRMEHRRIMSGVDRILSAPKQPPRGVSLSQAKRTLAMMATNNKKHGIAPHRDIVIGLPVDDRIR